MQDFTIHLPTKVFFGRQSESKIGSTLKDAGYKKALIHYGKGSVVSSGLLQRIITYLMDVGIDYVELGGVEPNPKIELVQEGVELAKQESVDIVVAVGGGSVIDSAKGICLAIANGQDTVYMLKHNIKPTKRFPLAVVLTISAAGSEMSSSHVITDPNTKRKRGLGSDLLRPDFAFMNPELTYTVGPYQTACGIVDTMMHTLERYFTTDVDTELTDRLAEGLLTAVKNAGYAVMKNPEDYEARATLMWASSVSHNGITGCGKTTFFPAHKLEHDISGLFDHVSHGAGLAVVFPAWAKYMYRYDVRKFAQLAVRVWGIDMDYDHPERTALLGIEALQTYFDFLGMPRTLTKLGVPKESWNQLASMTTDQDSIRIKSYVPLTSREILEIYALAD